jgi:hypothetical protein
MDPNNRSTQSDPQLSLDLGDFMALGIVLEMSPTDAEAFGAFEESALDEAAAWDANLDVDEADHV